MTKTDDIVVGLERHFPVVCVKERDNVSTFYCRLFSMEEKELSPWLKLPVSNREIYERNPYDTVNIIWKTIIREM